MKFSKNKYAENLKISFPEKLISNFEPCDSFGTYFHVNDHEEDVVSSRTWYDFGFCTPWQGWFAKKQLVHALLLFDKSPPPTIMDRGHEFFESFL